MDSFLALLRERIPTLGILEWEPMAAHTSFGIGGPARALLQPGAADHIPTVLACAHEAGVYLPVMGKGTNILVPDEGIPFPVLQTYGPYAAIRACGETCVEADAGCLLSHTAVFAQRLGLAGLAFAHGIPGSVGGAVYMNAGAYNGEIRNVLVKTLACDREGKLLELSGAAHEFGYRQSVFTKNPGLIALQSTFQLTPGDPAAIRAEMDDLARRRSASQPLHLPSAGSVFKRPPGYYTGALVEGCGLKGCTIGGAQVSEKHAGFIVNIGGATCSDVLRLIEHIQKTVLAAYGVELECEIRLFGA